MLVDGGGVGLLRWVHVVDAGCLRKAQGPSRTCNTARLCARKKNALFFRVHNLALSQSTCADFSDPPTLSRSKDDGFVQQTQVVDLSMGDLRRRVRYTSTLPSSSIRPFSI